MNVPLSPFSLILADVARCASCRRLNSRFAVQAKRCNLYYVVDQGLLLSSTSSKSARRTNTSPTHQPRCHGHLFISKPPSKPDIIHFSPARNDALCATNKGTDLNQYPHAISSQPRQETSTSDGTGQSRSTPRIRRGHSLRPNRERAVSPPSASPDGSDRRSVLVSLLLRTYSSFNCTPEPGPSASLGRA